MRVENNLVYSATLVVCVLLLTVFAFVMAMLLEDNGGFLANLALLLAAAATFICIGTVVAVVVQFFAVLTGQPFAVRFDDEGRPQVYRQRVKGSIVFHNVDAMSEPLMILHPPDQTPPFVQHIPRSSVQTEGRPLFRLPETVETIDDLGSLFRQSKESEER